MKENKIKDIKVSIVVVFNAVIFRNSIGIVCGTNMIWEKSILEEN